MPGREGRERVSRSLDFRSVPNPLANPAKQSNEIPVFNQIGDAIATHENKLNPHNQYALKVSLGTAASKATTDFEAAGTVSSAMISHKTEVDPHSQYTLKTTFASHELSTNHPLATTTAPGLMSSADKTKLNGLPLSGDFLAKASNFSDVPDKAVARTNLGLGSAAQASISSFEVAGAVSVHAAKYGKGFHVPVTGITDAELADAAAIAESKISYVIPERINAVYAIGWGTYVGGEPLVYRKFPDKLIQIAGVVSKLTAPVNNDLICTLPVGYRPDRLARFVICGSNSLSGLVPAFLTIATNGEVRLQLAGSNSTQNPSQFVIIPNNTIFFAP